MLVTGERLPCQNNLKKLTDTESDDENLYICIVEPPGPAYILAKVFSRCPESKSGKFYKRRTTMRHYARL